MTGRAGSVPKISVSELEILPYEHFIPVTGMNVGMNSGGPAMASSCIACSIFHIISIPFNCSDTASRVTDAQIGQKVKFLCLAMFALFPEFYARIRSQDL